VSGFVTRAPAVLPTPPHDTRAVLAEIEEIRSGLWDERIKVSLGIASPEPAPDAPTAQEVPEAYEEPTNEVEDASVIDAEPPTPQDEQITIDDSDATTDDPPVAQQVSQALEEEEVDLHLTPNSVPPSPKPIEEAAATQEQVAVTPEEPPQPVQEEAEPQSPFTEQDPEGHDAEGPSEASLTLLGLLTRPRHS
jgi:bromodomain-containing protein 8